MGIFIFSGSLIAPPAAFASTTDGTIDAVNKYAWAENLGWINFGTSQGNVHITAGGMTGYAWSENAGWISLNCSNDSSCATVNYGVSNNGRGDLSGYAWGENVGWINFNPSYGGVGVYANGDFYGYAWGENTGWIVFNCVTTNSCATVDYKVSTDYRPSTSPGSGNNPPASSPTPTVTPTLTPTLTPTPSPSVTVTPSLVPTPTPVPSGTPSPVPSVEPPPTSPPPILPPGPPGGGGEGGVTETVLRIIEDILTVEPIPIPPWVSQGARKIIGYIPGREQTVMGVTAISTVATVISTGGGASSLFGIRSLLDIADYLSYLFFSFFQFFTFKRRKPWGTAYDSMTKRPIPFAKVQLFDKDEEILDSQITDNIGRYGFLIAPRFLSGESIQVHLVADKRGYLFPSRRINTSTDTVLYQNVYLGEMIEVSRDMTANYDVPLDPLQEPRLVVPPRLWYRLGNVLVRAADAGFWVALVAAPVQYLAAPHLLNFFIVLVMLSLTFLRAIGLRLRPFGVVSDSGGNPIPFVLIVLNDRVGKRVDSTVSDSRGRYFLRALAGSYVLTAYTPAGIEPARSRTLEIKTRQGWITTPLSL